MKARMLYGVVLCSLMVMPGAIALAAVNQGASTGNQGGNNQSTPSSDMTKMKIAQLNETAKTARAEARTLRAQSGLERAVERFCNSAQERYRICTIDPFERMESQPVSNSGGSATRR